jgi:hypothetical protein
MVEGWTGTETRRISYCRSEDIAVSVIEVHVDEGFQASVSLFNDYLTLGLCKNLAGGTFTVQRLVMLVSGSADHVPMAGVVEVVSDNGVVLYVVSPNLEYRLEKGDPA